MEIRIACSERIKWEWVSECDDTTSTAPLSSGSLHCFSLLKDFFGISLHHLYLMFCIFISTLFNSNSHDSNWEESVIVFSMARRWNNRKMIETDAPKIVLYFIQFQLHHEIFKQPTEEEKKKETLFTGINKMKRTLARIKMYKANLGNSGSTHIYMCKCCKRIQNETLNDFRFLLSFIFYFTYRIASWTKRKKTRRRKEPKMKWKWNWAEQSCAERWCREMGVQSKWYKTLCDTKIKRKHTFLGCKRSLFCLLSFFFASSLHQTMRDVRAVADVKWIESFTKWK